MWTRSRAGARAACTRSPVFSRIFFSRSTSLIRAQYPQFDVRRRQASYRCTACESYTPRESTSCGLWPSRFSFRCASHSPDQRCLPPTRLQPTFRLSWARKPRHVCHASVRTTATHARLTDRRRRRRRGNVVGKSRRIECVAREAHLRRDQIRRGQYLRTIDQGIWTVSRDNRYRVPRFPLTPPRNWGDTPKISSREFARGSFLDLLLAELPCTRYT